MRKFVGSIGTRMHGSDCEFEFEVEDDATEEQIEEIAQECAFELIDWHFKEIEQ